MALKNLELLLNTSCELPLVELMKPGYITNKPCNLSQVLTLYKYRRLDDQLISEQVAKVLSASANFSVSQSLASQCVLYSGSNQTLPPCTVRHLKQLNFSGEALDIVSSLEKVIFFIFSRLKFDRFSLPARHSLRVPRRLRSVEKLPKY